MASLNVVMIMGNLGADPEVRTTGSGTAVANLRVGVNERYKDAQGNQQSRTEWFSVVLWGRLAEVARDYLRKGAQVYISGYQKTESWDDNGTRKYKVTLQGRNLQMCGERSASAEPHQPQTGDRQVQTRTAPQGNDTRPAPARTQEPVGEFPAGGDADWDVPF